MSQPTTGDVPVPSVVATQWQALAARRPRTAAVLAAAWHRPTAVLLPVAVLTTAVSVQQLQPYDLGWFIRGGLVITSGDALRVFADAGLQMGPVHLLLVGAVARLAHAASLPAMGAVGAVLAALLVLGADVVARRWAVLGGAPVLPARWAVGGAMVGGGMVAQVSTSGHQEELLLAVLLALAAAEVHRGRAVRTGLLLALGAGIKVWAVLGGPIVLHGRRPRTVVVGALTACAAAAAAYAPFVLWGEVRTLDFSWGIAGGSSLLATVGAWFGLDDWGLRCVQGVAAVLAGTAVAVRRHGSALAVPLAVIGTRLLLEPISSVYYVAPLVLLTVVWCWTSPARPRIGVRVAVLLLVPVSVLQYYLLMGTPSRVVEAVLCVVVLVGVLGRERTSGASRAHPTDTGSASSGRVDAPAVVTPTVRA